MAKAKIVRHWDNLTDFVNYAAGPQANPTNENQRQSRATGQTDWFGTPNFKSAESMAFNWEEGADRVNRMRAKVSLGNVRKAKVVTASKKAPGRLDMGRAMQGHPYAFVRITDHETELTAGPSRNVVDLFINLCVSAGVRTKTMEARGAAMLALAEALEQSGKRVRITVGMANGGGQGYDYRIVVKSPGQRLNLNSVAFSVAHPSFFRRFIFSAMECEEATIPWGYGSVREFDMDSLAPGTIYMGGAHLNSRNWNDENVVREWIKETMREQGISID